MGPNCLPVVVGDEGLQAVGTDRQPDACHRGDPADVAADR